MSRQYAPHIVLARNPARSRVKVTSKVDLSKVMIPKAEPPKVTPHKVYEPYYDPPWPETDDFGTISPLPRKVNTTDENKAIGDKIISIITKEVAMCRGFAHKNPATHIRLSPAPLSSHELVSYVVKKASAANSVKIVWSGTDTITIVF